MKVCSNFLLDIKKLVYLCEQLITIQFNIYGNRPLTSTYFIFELGIVNTTAAPADILFFFSASLLQSTLSLDILALLFSNLN